MCTKVIDALEFDASTRKRAQYEAFNFELKAPGLVTVRNESHENADEHSYRVNIENSIPIACECPSDTYHEGACKHRVAVAIREPVLEAASEYEHAEEIEVMTDGGTAIDRPAGGERTHESSGGQQTVIVCQRLRICRAGPVIETASECRILTPNRMIKGSV